MVDKGPKHPTIYFLFLIFHLSSLSFPHINLFLTTRNIQRANFLRDADIQIFISTIQALGITKVKPGACVEIFPIKHPSS